MLASKNIQPIRSCQVASKAINQVQQCGIGNEEVVARKKEEHYTSSYQQLARSHEQLKENKRRTTWTNHISRRQEFKIQMQRSGQQG